MRCSPQGRYSFRGNGIHNNAPTYHRNPSDLPTVARVALRPASCSTEPRITPSQGVWRVPRLAVVPAVGTRIPLPGMTTPLLTEGDLDRGQPPDLTSPHWRCGIVDPATGAACTLRPQPRRPAAPGLPGYPGRRPVHPPRQLDRRDREGDGDRRILLESTARHRHRSKGAHQQTAGATLLTTGIT